MLLRQALLDFCAFGAQMHVQPPQNETEQHGDAGAKSCRIQESSKRIVKKAYRMQQNPCQRLLSLCVRSRLAFLSPNPLDSQDSTGKLRFSPAEIRLHAPLCGVNLDCSTALNL